MTFSRLFLYGALLCLLACGGGGGGGGGDNGGGGSDPDDVIPTMELFFPPSGQTFLVQGDELGNPDRVTLRGSAADNDEVEDILVNGESVNNDFNFPDWMLFPDLNLGLNALSIRAIDRRANMSFATSVSLINEGPFMRFADSVMLDSAGNRLLIIDQRYAHIIEQNLSNNRRRILTWINMAGHEVPIHLTDVFVTAEGGVYKPSENQIYYAEILAGAHNLKRVDLDDGAIVTVSTLGGGGGIGDGPTFGSTIVNGMAYNGTDTVYVLGTDLVIAVDTVTGDRVEVAGSGTGTGAAFTDIRSIAWDSDANRLLAVGVGGRLLAIDVGDLARTMISEGGVTGAGPDFNEVNNFSLVYDAEENRALFFADDDSNADSSYSLFSVEMSSGDRSLISNAEHLATGTGYPDSGVTSLTVDPVTQKAYAVSRDLYSALEIDLASGNRRLLSSNLGGGTKLVRPGHGRFDLAGRRLLVADKMLQSIYAVDIDTGNRSLVSGMTPSMMVSATGMGGGTPFGEPVAVDINAARTTAYVLDKELNSIFSVDLPDGDRTVISGSGEGVLDTPLDMILDEDNARLLVADRGLNAIVEIDIASGDRGIIPSTHNLSVTRGPIAIEIDRPNDRAFIVVDDEESFFPDPGVQAVARLVELNLDDDTVQDLVTLAQAKANDIQIEDIAMGAEGDALYTITNEGIRKAYKVDLDTRQIVLAQNTYGNEFTNNKISAIETGPFDGTVYMFDESSAAVMLMDIQIVDQTPLSYIFEGVVLSQ